MNKEKKYSKFTPMIFTTVVYFLLVLIFAILNYQNFKCLKPNEWGDFFAGFFAPLAFFWLVFGYYQQGQELSNNIEEQNQLTRNNEEQLDILRKDFQLRTYQTTINAQPYFHISDLKIFIHQLSEDIQISIFFKNSRAICRGLYFLYETEESIAPRIPRSKTFDIIKNDLEEPYKLNIFIPLENINLTASEPIINLNFMYLDSYDNIQSQKLKVSLGGNIKNDSEDYYYQWGYKSFINQ